MSFRNLLVVVFLGLGLGAVAHAQLGVYGTYTANRLSGLTCFAVAPQTCSGTGGTVNPSGVQGGIYYDFKSFGPIRLGGDVRGGTARSNKSASTSGGGDNLTTQNSVMVGARALVKTPISWIRPYAEVAGGWARSDVTEPTHTYDNFAEYEGFVGADIRVLPVVDLRAIELGIGNMNRFGTGSGPTSVTVKTIAIGVVFHLP